MFSFFASTSSLHGCITNADCSLNGICDDRQCACEAAWTGPQCDRLAFTAALRHSGYRHKSLSGTNTSSWGGSVLHSETDRRWHMWTSEIINNCGLNAWQSNSRIVHTVSDEPTGEFTFVDEVVPVFAHNPTVVRGEKGEYVMLFEYSEHHPCGFQTCSCDNGTTTQACIARQAARHCDYNRARWPSYMAFASDANGPWSEPELIPIFRDVGGQGDFNLSPIIFPNGSALILYRWGGGTPYESHLRLGHAVHWRNVSSYTISNATDLFPGLPTGGFEDPFAYRDARGRFHALIHSMVGEESCHRLGDPSGKGACGAHIFSEDGLTWHTHAVSGAYNGTVNFAADATAAAERLIFTRRERPHAIFAPGSCGGGSVLAPCGEPLAVTTSVVYPPLDGSFTLLQPLLRSDLTIR